MLNQELVAETIQDLQDVKDKILARHEGDTTLTLRFDSVFNQLINSLGNSTGMVVPGTSQAVTGTFTPMPLKSVAGQKINEKTGPLKLQPLEVDQKEAFKQQIQEILESFPNRENGALLEALNEIQIRGVAKLAGVPDYESEKIDGGFIQKIKDQLTANEADKASREAAKKDLKPDQAETQKPTEKTEKVDTKKTDKK